jgi:hypothetical protein
MEDAAGIQTNDVVVTKSHQSVLGLAASRQVAALEFRLAFL